jgi:hypothetical protein
VPFVGKVVSERILSLFLSSHVERPIKLGNKERMRTEPALFASLYVVCHEIEDLFLLPFRGELIPIELGVEDSGLADAARALIAQRLLSAWLLVPPLEGQFTESVHRGDIGIGPTHR